MTYFVASLPRSRTTWFAAYFNALGSNCLHEALCGCEEKEDFDRRMAAADGNADCGLVISDFQDRFPGAPTVIIHRDPVEVQRSMARLGYPIDISTLQWLSGRLKRLSGLHVKFHDIDRSLEQITRYVGIEYNERIASVFCDMKIEPKVIRSNVRSMQLWLG